MTILHVTSEPLVTRMMHIIVIRRKIANTIRLTHFISPPGDHARGNGSFWQHLDQERHLYIHERECSSAVCLRDSSGLGS